MKYMQLIANFMFSVELRKGRKGDLKDVKKRIGDLDHVRCIIDEKSQGLNKGKWRINLKGLVRYGIHKSSRSGI